jgi:CheY-like chemotaxis protein
MRLWPATTIAAIAAASAQVPAFSTFVLEVWSIAADTYETLYLNAAAERVYGWPASAFYADPKLYMNIVHPEDRPRVARMLPELIEHLVLPGEDGLCLARSIRQRSEIPIIMLTGKGDLIDRVVGLEIGADDYITKPFELREVLARIRTVMRRAGPRTAPVKSVSGTAADETSSKVLGAGASTCSDASSVGRQTSSCPSPPESSSCCACLPAIPIAC